MALRAFSERILLKAFGVAVKEGKDDGSMSGVGVEGGILTEESLVDEDLVPLLLEVVVVVVVFTYLGLGF